jgi:hypothetical protein
VTNNKAYHVFQKRSTKQKQAKGSAQFADTYGVDDVCMRGAPTDGPALGVMATFSVGVSVGVGDGVGVVEGVGDGVGVRLGVFDGVGVIDGVGRIQVIGSRPKISVAL